MTRSVAFHIGKIEEQAIKDFAALVPAGDKVFERFLASLTGPPGKYIGIPSGDLEEIISATKSLKNEKIKMALADVLVPTATAFKSLNEMVNVPTYFPTFCTIFSEQKFIADCYDEAQEKRGDKRRACRT